MKKLDFKTAFKYPFNRAKGMWNILWILLPIFGWFALGGYGVRIVKEFIKGKFKRLPSFEFKSDLKLGFAMFIKFIPFVVVYSLLLLGVERVAGFLNIKNQKLLVNLVEVFLGLFIVPTLTINFLNKETISSLFEIEILKSVFNNFDDYVVALLKSILLSIIFLVMWMVLVGIPAGTFTKNMFLADFYRRRVK